ncbi:Thyrotropin-releasing hormone receptor [Halotydeus destructor]|nr:Thyrotropin-releasing hormone receptor [Halotydeus destructor]
MFSANMSDIISESVELNQFSAIEDIRFPLSLRLTATIICLILLIVGCSGNFLIAFVVLRTKDMRNSTNLFLVNLSIADLFVLITCAPTVLVELHSKPEVWYLGALMCKSVSFIELLVAHSSVLTILGIGFERYYAICRPLEASSKLTRKRALLIIAIIWFTSLISCLPMLSIARLELVEYIDASQVPVCTNSLQESWQSVYYTTVFFIFFVGPFCILLVLFFVMRRQLIRDSEQMLNSNQYQKQLMIRKQVVIMVATVCLTFFICLFPFRLMTLWIINTTPEKLQELGMENYYILLYSCRMLIYTNSAINPILYNIISTKFRRAFCRTLRIPSASYALKSHVVLSERMSTTILRTGHSSPIIFNADKPKTKIADTVVDVEDEGTVKSIHSL